jgi:hypothetical protein
MAAVLALAAATISTAGDDKASRKDAPRQLGEALRTGTADVETIATIVRWVLEEKEEKVAPALAAALQAAFDEGEPAGRALDGRDAQWNAVARGAVDLFAGVLDDARAHRRRDAESLARDLAPLMEAAAPAVADALEELDPLTREALRRSWDRLAPALPCPPPR